MGIQKSKQPQKIQYLTLSVYTTLLTIVVCYIIRPDFIGIRKAFSSLGAYTPTSYIFTGGFLLSAVFLVLDALKTKGIFQKICRFLAALGFFMLGVFQIEHGQTRGDLHRLGGLIMLLAIIVSMIGHVIAEWGSSKPKRRIMYLCFTTMAVTSVVMSILSSAQFEVIALQGLAQYIGLLSLVGWAILDSNQR